MAQGQKTESSSYQESITMLGQSRECECKNMTRGTSIIIETTYASLVLGRNIWLAALIDNYAVPNKIIAKTPVNAMSLAVSVNGEVQE